MEIKKNYDIECNVAHVLNIIGEKWTLLIAHNIIKKELTFKELREILTNIPTNLLSNRLKILEKNEIITSVMYSKHPPRYKYKITEKGKDLKPLIYSMILWGEKYLGECKATIRTKTDKRVNISLTEEDTGEKIEFDDVYITEN